MLVKFFLTQGFCDITLINNIVGLTIIIDIRCYNAVDSRRLGKSFICELFFLWLISATRFGLSRGCKDRNSSSNKSHRQNK